VCSSDLRSGVYRPLFKQFFWIFAAVCVGLGYLGSRPAEGIYVDLSQILTVAYFAHFLIILPILGKVEKARERPASIADAVLGVKKSTPSAQPAE